MRQSFLEKERLQLQPLAFWQHQTATNSSDACQQAQILLSVVSACVPLSLQAEKHVSDMVVSAALYAKIDRPAGIVRFAKRQEPDELLNKWSNNLAKLLEVVEHSCQQIQKESMVHKVPISSS